MQARVFLVGCSRSGTTIVQRCLNAHPAVTSFPETNFFGRLVGGWSGRIRARCGRVRAHRWQSAFGHLEDVLERPGTAAMWPPGTRFGAAVEGLTETLDAVACERGAQVWVEKTPKHFRYVDLLEARVPAARFIHLVRDGRAVVASLVDRASRYPQFSSRRAPRAAARLWNESVRAAFRASGRDAHRVLTYEDFVADPEGELRGICAWLGLEYDAAMVSDADASAIVTGGEAWKAGTEQPIAGPRSRFEEVFTPRQQRAVTRMLDWRLYRALCYDEPRRDGGS